MRPSDSTSTASRWRTRLRWLATSVAFILLCAGRTWSATVPAPIVVPPAGTYETPIVVLAIEPFPETTLHVTVDGSTPTAASPVYQLPFIITDTTTVQFIAYRTGYAPSPVADVTYVIHSPDTVARPTFAPAPGTFTTGTSVSLLSATAGAAIVYTTDGTAPTPFSTRYTAPIPITETTAIRAIAIKPGFFPSGVTLGVYTIQVATPTLSPGGGAYTTSQTVKLTTATPGSQIRFTLDGSSPSATSALYTAPVPITVSETLHAQAYKTGDTPSAVATGTYTLTAAAPTLTPPGGTYSTAQTVTVATTTAGGVIHYTLDGSVPTATSPVAGSTVPITESATLTARTFVTGWTPSPVTAATYTLVASAPVPTPPAGTYHAAQAVTLTTTTPGATIRYTLDGSDPASSATAAIAAGPIAITRNTTLTARTLRTGWTSSSELVAAYVLQPTAPVIAPASGTFADTITATITAAAGTTIHYTVNGSAPTAASPVANGPITIAESQTLEAIAVETGWQASPVASAAYLIQVATPTATPAAGTVAAGTPVTLACTTSSAIIHYTLDGSTPTLSSPVASGPIPITQSLTLTAQAYRTGCTPSALLVAVYMVPVITVATPTLSPGGGGYTTAQTVSMASATPGSQILYTLDGSAPSTTSPLYTAPVAIAVSTTVRAQAFKAGDQPSAVATATYTLTADAPTLSPPGGMYGTPQSVTLATTTAGGVIHYTLDGSSPTLSSPVATGPVAVTTSATLTAATFLSGWTSSPAVAATYTLIASAPVASPPAGTYHTSTAITLSTSTTGAIIRYTLDGSDPASSATAQTASGPIAIAQNATITARSLLTGWTTSPELVAAYVLQPTAPVITPASETVADTLTATITAAGGTTIHYTLDGSVPGAASPVASGPITISVSETLQAVALEPGWQASPIASAAYLIQVATPTATPAAGTVAWGTTITLGCATSGATIYYTLDGSTPTTASPVASGPIVLTQSLTVTAIAVRTGCTTSAPLVAVYSIPVITVAPPTLSPPPGIYDHPVAVALASTTPSADIQYTLDGSQPIASSPIYGAPITLTTSATITAVAGRPGDITSPVVAGTYTLMPDAPTITPPGGTFATPQVVTVATTTSGATVLYTTDGSNPVSSATARPVTGPVTIAANETLMAAAVMAGWSPSAATSATFAFQAGLPAITPASGTYDGPLSVTMTPGTAGGSIRYTSDGTPPATSATALTYTSPVVLTASATIQAVTVISGWSTSATASATYQLRAAPVTFTPPGGSSADTISVALASPSPGAVITYTTDGSDPATSTTAQTYTGPVVVAVNETISARCTAPGYAQSDETQSSYAIQVAPPTFSPVPGSYTQPVSVLLTSATSGAVVHYTLDGSQPTAASPIASAGIPLATTTTVTAIALRTGCTASPAVTGTFTITLPIAAAPIFTPPAGTYAAGQSVTLTSTTPGAVVIFTTDGTDPRTSSTAQTASGPMAISQPATLIAYAMASGYQASAESTAIFAFQAAMPSITPAGGSFSDTTAAVLATASPGAAIYYTLDGSDPTPASAGGQAHVTVTIAQAATVTARAFVTGWTASAPATASFTFQVAAPMLTAGGTFTGSATVLASTSTSGAILHYTIDGSTPTASSPVFPTSLVLTATTTVTVVGVRTGFATSPSVSSLYTILPTGSLPVTAPPVFTPPAGAYATTQDVIITSSTPNAVIMYTTDGSDPMTSLTSQTATGPISVAQPATIIAYASAPGYLASPENSAIYAFQDLAPAIAPAGGNFTDTVVAVLTSANPTASIFYTLDGSDPTPSSLGGPTPVNAIIAQNATLTARSFVPGWAESTPASSVFSFQVATPVLTAGGTFAGSVAVNAATTTTGAVLLYTVDGSMPTVDSPPLPATLVLTATTTVSVIGVRNGFAPSAVASTIYNVTPAPLAATPTFSLASGTYPTAQTMTIASSTPNAEILFTTDGSDPANSLTAQELASPVTLAIPASQTLVAYAVAPGFDMSPAAAANITIASPLPPADTPILDPPSGTFPTEENVIISSVLAGATITYTTDGSDPAQSSTAITAASPVSISVGQSGDVIAFANAPGYAPGAEAIGTYIIAPLPVASAPVFNPPAGFYLNEQAISITSSTPNAVIAYTTDGSDPAVSATARIASGPVILSLPENVIAIANAPGCQASVETTANYALASVQAAEPTMSPPGGAYAGTQQVTLSTTTSGAGIWYTLDGSDPLISVTAALATGPIPIASTQTLTARALLSGAAPSPAANGTYIIDPPPSIVTPATAIPSVVTGTFAMLMALGDDVAGAQTLTYLWSTTGPQPGPVDFSSNGSNAAQAVQISFAASGTYTFQCLITDADGQSITTQVTATVVPTATTVSVSPATASVTIGQATPFAATVTDQFGVTLTPQPTLLWSAAGGGSIDATGAFTGTTMGGPFVISASCAPAHTGTALVSVLPAPVPPTPPTLTPPGGTYASPTIVSFSTTTPGGIIYYTLDGSVPTAASPIALGPIEVAQNVTINAVTSAPGYPASAMTTQAYAFMAAAPILSPGSGMLSTSGASAMVTAATTMPGATMRYTLDGSDPTNSYYEVNGPIAIPISSSPTTLKVIAEYPGWSNSPITTGIYQVQSAAQTAPPVFLTASGVINANATVNVFSPMGGQIYYTVDGSMPTTSSLTTGGFIYPTASGTINAIAVIPGFAPSSVASATFTLQTPMPSCSPIGGAYGSPVTISFSSYLGVPVHYTLDGSQPTLSSPTASSLTISATTTVQFAAFGSGWLPSPVVSQTYTILNGASVAAPTITPDGGNFTTTVIAQISDSTPGVTIRYTVDGTTPTSYSASSSTGTLAIGQTTTVKAVAFLANGTASPITTAVFTLPPASATLAVSTSIVSQTITGIGGNFAIGRFTGSAVPNDTVGQATVAQLSPTHARIGIPLQGWQPAPADPNAPDTQFQDTGDVHNVFLLMQQLANQGIPIVATVWDAPDWMIANPSATTQRIIANGQQTNFVTAVTAFLVHARDFYGVTIALVSINEANGGYNLLLSADDYASIVIQSGAAFNAAGLSTKWLAGDGFNSASTPSFAQPVLANATALPFIGAVSFHSWDAYTVSNTQLAALPILAQQYKLPVWCTEVGYDTTLNQQTPSPFPTWANAWQLALISHRVLTAAQASVLDYWSYQDEFPLADPMTGTLYPAGMVVQQLESHLPVGSQLVQVTTTDPTLWALSAIQQQQNLFMIQVINTGTSGQLVAIQGLPATTLSLQQTSESQSLANLGSFTVPSSGMLSITLPAQSISTLYGSLTTTTSPVPANPSLAIQPMPAIVGAPNTSLPLQGAITSSGLASTLYAYWQVVNGPGQVTFQNAYGLQTTASFSKAGTYQLQLTASVYPLSAQAMVTVVIETPVSGLHVNFQPSSAPVPFGYMPDSGAVCGYQGSGYSYGWSAPAGPAIERDSDASPDERYDTFIPLPSATEANVWQIAVPNGAYSVHVAAGDPLTTGSTGGILVNGVPVLDGTTDAAQPWIEGTITITVADGFITIGAAADAMNIALDFVDIIEVPPVVEFAQAQYAIAANAGIPVGLVVTINEPFTQNIIIPYAVTGGTAVSGTDYQPLTLPQSVSIPAGGLSALIPITPLPTSHPGAPTVIVSLGMPSIGTLGSPASTTLSFVNPAPAPMVAFAQNAITTTDQAGVVPIVIALSEPATSPVTVTCAIVGGTGKAGIDFVPLPAGYFATINPGSTSVTVDVTLPSVGAVYNTSKTIILALSNAQGATVGAAAVETVTIVHNEPPPAVAFTTTGIAVSQSIGTVTIPVSLAMTSGLPATIHYSLSADAPGTAVQGSNFTMSSGTIEFAPGQSMGSLTVTILPTGQSTSTTIGLELSAPANCQLGTQSTFLITISGVNSLPVPTIVFQSAAGQNDESISSIAIPVVLNGITDHDVEVSYQVIGGTAAIGLASDPAADIILPNGIVIIPAGGLSATITATIVSKATPQPNKTAIVQLASPIGANLGTPSTYTYTIINDVLPAPVVTATSATATMADLWGAVPAGLNISQIIVSNLLPASITTYSGIIDNGLFQIQIENGTPPAQAAMLSLAYVDSYGHVGPASQQSFAFNGNAGGTGSGNPGGTNPAVPVTTGNLSTLPPATPTMTIVVGSGLTGDMQGQLNQQSVNFTKNSSVSLQVTITEPLGTITYAQIESEMGVTAIPITGGSVTYSMPSEGTYHITGTVFATNGGWYTNAITSSPTIIVYNQTPPTLAYYLRQDYGPPGYNPSVSPIPMISSTTDQNKLIYLNGSSTALNSALRTQRTMNVFDQGGFTALATVVDPVGLSQSGTLSAQAVAIDTIPLQVDVSPQDPSQGAQTVTISGFGSLPIQTNGGNPPTQDEGIYTVQLSMTDRCGNTVTLENQFFLECESSYPSQSTGSLATLSYQGGVVVPNTGQTGSPSSMSEMNPARYVTANAIEMWQDSMSPQNHLVMAANRGFWFLNTPMMFDAPPPVETQNGSPPDNNSPETASSQIVALDIFGNYSSQLTVNATRFLDFPGYQALEGTNGDNYIVTGYEGGFNQQPIFRSASSASPQDDKMEWTLGSNTGSSGYEASLQASQGIRDVSVTVDNNVTGGLSSANINTDSGNPQYTPIAVNPIDAGMGPTRLASPAILTITPSWINNSGNIPQTPFVVTDAGIQVGQQSSGATKGVIGIDALGDANQPGAGTTATYSSAPGQSSGQQSGALTAQLTINRMTAIPGLSTIHYSIANESSPYYSNSGYNNMYGINWVNFIRISPDVVTSGCHIAVRIAAGFLGSTLTVDGSSNAFQPTGDYVHFLMPNGSSATDVTVTASAYQTDLENSSEGNTASLPLALMGKIAIVSQRLVLPPDSTRNNVQYLDLDLIVDPQVAAGLYHVDVNCGAVQYYSDPLSQANKGANGAFRMPQAFQVFQPTIDLTVPGYAECVRKRAGSVDEPVIDIESGGDGAVNGCSLIGYADKTQTNVWTFTAQAAKTDLNDQSSYAWTWDTGGGQITSGTAGAIAAGTSGNSDGSNYGSPSITVQYQPGIYTPKLNVFRTYYDVQSQSVRTQYYSHAEIHFIVVYDRTVDGSTWAIAPVSDTYGSNTAIVRNMDQGASVNAQLRLDANASGTVRARVSADGYPQNEYWVTSTDSGDLPQALTIAPLGQAQVWVQGYANPSQSQNDSSVRVVPSSQYGTNPTAATFSSLRVDVNVDANRDQQITFDGSDATSLRNPYRFWLNNNHDAVVANQYPGDYTEEDEVQGGPPDSANNQLQCRRDLEDFSRLWVTISNRNVIESRLGQRDTQLSFNFHPIARSPEVKIFLSADPNGGLGHLTDYEGVATNQIFQGLYDSNVSDVSGSGDVAAYIGDDDPFSLALVSDANAPDGIHSLAPFLFEGVQGGVGELGIKLKMTINGQTIVVGHDHVTLDIRDIHQFYEQYTIGDTSGVFSPASGIPTLFPGSIQYSNQDPYFSDPHYLLFVHGWNMLPWEKNWFSSCGYKRLWWNGYKGRYGAFRWPTYNGFNSWYDPLLDPTNYDNSEYIAWQAGERLAQFLPVLNGINGFPIDLLGHSMGNVVISNALNKLSPSQGNIIGTYIASQAAVSAQLFRSEGTAAVGCRPWSPNFHNIYTSFGSPNVYQTGLLQALPANYSICNFTNANDYALSITVSGWDQIFKPDQGLGGYLPGSSGLNVPVDIFRERFFRPVSPLNGLKQLISLLLWNGTGITQTMVNDLSTIYNSTYRVVSPISPSSAMNQYYIMSYLSPSRVYPLGASSSINFSTSNGDCNLWNVWSNPPSKVLTSAERASGNFSGNRWHSGEFRMTMPEQYLYWGTLMKSCQYNTANTLR
jgi:hypothetical protein